MEVTVTGSIRTPWGEVDLIPQDRNLLQASSVEPLQFGDVTIHLWAMGVKASHIAQLETDCGPRPSFQLLSRVANVLELDKELLFKLAETGANSSSSERKAASSRENRVWTAFAHNRALLDHHNVKPQELEALSKVSLMGKITRPEALLFILNAIRDSGDTEE